MNEQQQTNFLAEIGIEEKVKVEYTDCEECGAEMALMVIDEPKEYHVRYHCKKCGYDETDSYIDLYGYMAAPHGCMQ